MTIAAAQYDAFKKQVVRVGRVFTFTQDDSYLVFPVGSYEVAPFRSSRTRLEEVRAAHPKYRAFAMEEQSLADFMELLPRLAADRVRVGTNWSGRRLVGYDVERPAAPRARR